MNKASVIKDINTQELYGAVIHDGKSAAIAIPYSLKSVEWAAWLNDSKATFNEVKAVLDLNLQQELSVDIDRHFVKSVEDQYGEELARKVELYIPGDQFVQDGKTHPTMGTSIRRKSLKGVTRTNLYSTRLDQIDAKDRQAALNFKARRFRTEQKVTALNIQVKRVRAVFDANIGPGGGWRCPDGTLNGGQITDRFGRGCGGGLTRRIGRALMRAGRRLDDIGTGRDARRLARRTQAAVNRRERGERIREGRRAIANRLDAAADRLVGDFAPARPGRGGGRDRTPSQRRPQRDLPTQGVPGLGERRDQRREDEDALRGFRFDENGNLVRDDDNPINEILPGGEVGRRWSDMDDAELEEALARNELQKPPTDGRIGFKPESEAEQRRKRANQAAIRAEQAFRRGEGRDRPAGEGDAGDADAPEAGRTPGRRPGRRPSEQRPVRPRRPQGERRPTPDADADADRPSPSDSDDPFDFIEDPDERERVKEALGPWAQVLADLIRDRRRGDGGDGERRPRRERRGSARGEESEEQRSLMQKIMDFFAQAIQRLGEFRERRGESRERRRERRNERRRQIARALDDAAARVLQEEGKPKRRRRGTERGRDRTDVNGRARGAAERVVPDSDDRSQWRKNANRQWREERGIPENLKDLDDNELETIQEILQTEEDEFNANPDTFDMFVEERRRNLGRLKAERRRRDRRRRREEAAAPVPDAERAPEARTAAGLGDRSDDDILNDLSNFIRGDDFPYDLENLSDDDLDRLNRIVNANNGPRQPLRERNRVPHPAVERINDERNRRGIGSGSPPREDSVPDEASLRNVRNRFPDRGLPQRAYWRDRNRPGWDRDKQREMDERFGRYYDRDGNLNERGSYINNDLRDQREAARRPLDADERDRLEEQANRSFDRTRTPDGAGSPGDTDAPDVADRPPGQLDNLSDDEIRDRLQRYRYDQDDPFNMPELYDDEVARLQEIVDNNMDIFEESERSDGRRDVHPAFRLVGGEFNIRQNEGREGRNRGPRPRVDEPDTAGRRRQEVDRALADNPAPPDDFGEQVRSWREGNNRDALERAFNMYQDRENALQALEQRLRDGGFTDEADEIRQRRKDIAYARRLAMSSLQRVDPDWNPGLERIVDAPDPDSPGFGPGSAPDERSFQNVWRAFRQRGLPARRTWRDRNRRNYSETRERDYDRRFNRYYDENGDLNERGRYVNRKLRERREAEGRPLEDREVEQVISLAEVEQQERELSAPPVPDAAPAARAADAPDGDVPDIAQNDIQAAIDGTAARRVQDIVDRLRNGGAGPDTPNEIQELLDEERRITGQMGDIRARLAAHSDGRAVLSDAEVADLEEAYLQLHRARNATAPGAQTLFRDLDQTKIDVRGTTYDEGIFHPMFDDYREDFFRQRYAIPAGINAIIGDGAGREDSALDEVVSFVNQEWLDNGGALGPEDFSGILGWKGGGWDGMDADRRAETIRYLAMASISSGEMDDNLRRRIGMSRDDANRMAVAASSMKRHAQSVRRKRELLYNRTISGDMPQTIEGRIDELKSDVDSWVASYQAMVDAARVGLQGDGDGRNFLRALGQRYKSERDLRERDQGLFEETPNELTRQLLLAQNHASLVADRARDIYQAPIGVDRAADERRLADIDHLLNSGAMLAAQRWVPSNDPLQRYLGEYVALSMTRTSLTRQQLETRKQAIRNAWGIPNPPDANLGAQRVVNEPNGVVNGVQDLIDPDSEAGALIDGILENAQKKRRRSLTQVFRKKYPNDTGNPWDNYKRRHGGSHPFTADTIHDVFRNGTPEQIAEAKAWIKNAYEVEVDGPNGTKARTVVTDVALFGDEIVISGNTRVTFADGREKSAGSMTRRLERGGKVYSSLFVIGTENQDWDMITGRRVTKRAGKWYYSDSGLPLAEGHHIAKGMGLASAVNGHSWGWLKDAGFEKVGVSPAWDGPYIWGRVGYRGSPASIREVWRAADQEVTKFREGRQSIIKSEEQARMISELARRARAANYESKNSPAQMELIYALEHGASDAERSRRIAAVRTWVRSNAPIGGSTLYLDGHSFDAIDESTDAADVQLNRRGVNVHGGHMLRGFVRPQPPDERRGQIATPVVASGDLPEPRIIENASIQSPEQAADFLRRGGSLSEVPNQYWISAIKSNSSRTEVDPGSMFYEKPPRDGNIADTRIFLLRDADGRPTNQGLVIKGSRPNQVGQGIMDDVYAEVASYNLAAAVGIMPEGAGYVGVSELNPRVAGRGQGEEAVFAVIPHAANLAPGNGSLTRGAADYDPALLANAPDRGLPARTAHFFHNFFLGSADRHDKNGGTFIDENGNAIVVPYDQGRVAVGFYANLPQYRWLGADASVSSYKFAMDSRLFTEMQAHVRSLNRADATRFRREMLERYDDMVSRYRSAISGGRDEFIRRMSIGAPDTVGGRDVRGTREQRLGEIYDHLKTKVDRASEHREYLKRKLSIPRGAQ